MKFETIRKPTPIDYVKLELSVEECLSLKSFIRRHYMSHSTPPFEWTFVKSLLANLETIY